MIADRSQVEELAKAIATFEVDRDERARAEGRGARVGRMVDGVFVETVRSREEMIAAYSTDEDVTLNLAERLITLGYQRITPDSIVVPRGGAETMAATFSFWRSYDASKRTAQGLATDDDTHIMNPPTWPTHGVLKAWSNLLLAAVPPPNTEAKT